MYIQHEQWLHSKACNSFGVLPGNAECDYSGSLFNRLPNYKIHMEKLIMNNKTNGIDVIAFQKFADKVTQNPDKAKARFSVQTDWAGQTRTVSTIKSYDLFEKSYERTFHITADEPVEILGTNTAPNPQELLMTALNACLSVAYVAIAASKGINVNSLKINTTGELDLRGFLGLDENVNPGFDSVQYTVHIDAEASQQQIEEIHQAVLLTSPNYANFSRSIKMEPKLIIEKN